MAGDRGTAARLTGHDHQWRHARLNKAALRSPVAGIVKLLVAEPGEAIRPAQPVMIIEAEPERYLTFNLREDRLGAAGIGATLDLAVAGNGQRIAVRVTALRRLGDFATWRAARAVGDHDLNTFLIRADPASRPAGLEPGMTVFWPDPADERQAPPNHR